MAQDFAYRLQDYAYTVIKDEVGLEFERHMNDWKTHSNNLVQHARRGLSNYQSNLEKAKKAMEAERERNSRMAMFVLSLLAGPAMSFVSGALEHRLGPKLFGDRHSSIRTRPNAKYTPPTPPPPPPVTLPKPARVISPLIPRGQPTPPKVKMPHAGRTINPTAQKPPPPKPAEPPFIEVKVYDPNWSQTKSKVLGDFGGNLTNEFLVNPTIKARTADTSKVQNAINRVPDSVDLEDLNTNLDYVWREAGIAGKQAMQYYANTIREDSSWGDRLWAKLGNGTLAGVRSSTNDADRFESGKSWIHTVVDQQRQKWAMESDWFYYGNAPVPISPSQTVAAIETELWALWIAQEAFRPKKVERYGRTDREGNVEDLGSYDSYDDPEGRSRIDINKVLPYLVNLGIVPTSLTHMEQYRRLKPVAEQSGLMPVEINDISGEVDTEAELRSINSWAANRKPVVFGGSMGSVRRSLGKLVFHGRY